MLPIFTVVKFLPNLLSKVKSSIKVATLSDQEKSIMNVMKFVIIISGWVGISGINSLKDLLPEDLLLVTEVLSRYVWLQYVLLGFAGLLTIKWFLLDFILPIKEKGMLSFIIQLTIYHIPKFLWFVVFDVILGFLETLFSKEKSFSDFIKELFLPIFKQYQIKQITRRSNLKVIQIKSVQDTILNKMLDTNLTKVELNKLHKLFDQNQVMITKIRKKQSNDIEDILKS